MRPLSLPSRNVREFGVRAFLIHWPIFPPGGVRPRVHPPILPLGQEGRGGACFQGAGPEWAFTRRTEGCPRFSRRFHRKKAGLSEGVRLIPGYSGGFFFPLPPRP